RWSTNWPSAATMPRRCAAGAPPSWRAIRRCASWASTPASCASGSSTWRIARRPSRPAIPTSCSSRCVVRPEPEMSPLRRRDLLVATAVVGVAAAVPAVVRGQGAVAPPAEVAAALPGARLQGSGLLRVLGFRVYDIRLWVGAAAVGGDWSQAAAATPLALEIEYARRLVGAQIAERSLVEMRRQGGIAEADAERWLAAMTRIFPDVAQGDRITGLHLPGRGARFFVNGALR